MKLIVDIPDKVYDILTEYQVLPENIDLEYFVIHSTPLEEELEKIKAEIDTLYGVYLSRFTERLVIKTDVMQILDRHISELKGGAE